MSIPDTAVESAGPFAFTCSPNPFSSDVRLLYTIPGSCQGVPTRLSIFDITGRHVDTLVDELQEAGSYEIIWRATHPAGRALPPGVYFHVLQAGSERQTQRVLLMR